METTLSGYDSRQMYGFLPSDTKGVDLLAQLALDMRWSWNHAADSIWQQIDPEIWELTHNPWIVLQSVSKEKLEKTLKEPGFLEEVQTLWESKVRFHKEEAWFQKYHSDSPLSCVAYFSMEYMLDEALPIYAGGLGNVAGDQLKAASDLGIPLVAVGLFYQQGYFRQSIDENGKQQAYFPHTDPGQVPIIPLRKENGEWLRLKIEMDGNTIWLRTWQVQVGRVRLYLMDSNDPANFPMHRCITNELYGGGPENRIRQEIILGIGGWRLLRAIGHHPEVCHLNEGHAAFLVLERARDLMNAYQLTFEEALATGRAGNLFTTHTAVPAGFDHFSPELLRQYLGEYVSNHLQIDFSRFLALGKLNTENASGHFNMAYLAIRGSGAVNGVSRLHGEVSRRLFSKLFPRFPFHEIPIGHVTNGVHMPSWDSKRADKVWTQACGKDRWRGQQENLHAFMKGVPHETLWNMRRKARSQLVTFIRSRLEREKRLGNPFPHYPETAAEIFNPDTLTLGFARRFVPYKRTNLLLHQPQRLAKLLTDADKPLQLVISGKAHPYDDTGNKLIRQWLQFIEDYNLQRQLVFLSDYDMSVAEKMVQGVDVWLNTPRRPWEASGTSGMKVLVNGGLNLSVLDGWWAEAYSPEVGWALGDGQEHGEDPAWDARDAEALYDLLEFQVIPEFYDRNQDNLPEKWLEKIRSSISELTPRFSANRTVREYTEQYYLPAAEQFLKRTGKDGESGREILKKISALNTYGQGIHFNEVHVERSDHKLLFTAYVTHRGIPAKDLSVEVFAEGLNGSLPEQHAMKAVSENGNGSTVFTAEIKTGRQEGDFTPRVRGNFPDVLPLEHEWIIWAR
ncbi:alpha-glucan family phosphorylase [Negadavirga shengliensis]|uniref:Alpha-glucan family phosphorylase n=1 Tax=Negadavirga shengliensis TaxID=1389218 RepID=A0ABV9T4Z8_9BACT